jgi:selenocysteine lyase
VEELLVDYLTIVGHKFYAPKIGALYAQNCLKQNLNYKNDEIRADLRSLKCAPIHHMFFGAGQESGLRPGTENTPMIVGLGKAAELITLNLDKYSNHMTQMRNYLELRLKV